MSAITHEILEALQRPELLEALAAALAPLLSGRSSPKPKPTASVAAATPAATTREEELLGIIRELRGTVKDLRAALQAAGGTLTPSKAQANAAKDETPSYREALQRRMKTQSRLVVQDVPDLGEPLQPTATAVHEIEGKYGFTAVQGRRIYQGEHKTALKSLQQIGANKPVNDWKVTEATAKAFEHVLLVGQPLAEAHAIATQALMKYDSIQSVSAHVLATNCRRGVVNVPGILAALGSSRECLHIKDFILSIKVVTKRMSWEVKRDPGVTVIPPEHSILLCWERPRDGVEGKDTEPEVLPQDKAAIRIVCCLDPSALRAGQDSTKVKASRWAENTCWELTAPLLQPALTSPPPMQVGKRGSKYEVTVVLPAPMAKQVLCSSGKIVGLEYRLFMSKTVDVDDLKANMVWVKLPPSNKRSISEQWRRLSKQPWFAGLMAGDKDDRLGVRVWGGAVLPETREEIAGLLGIQLTPPVTRVRVRGYGISMGLVSGSQSAAQREADRVFGANTVKVQRCQHLKHSGLINPVFDMDITGVPPDWEGCTAPAKDSRMPVRRWHLCLRKSTGPSYTPVGKNTTLPAIQGCVLPDDEEMEDSPAGVPAAEEDESIL